MIATDRNQSSYSFISKFWWRYLKKKKHNPGLKGGKQRGGPWNEQVALCSTHENYIKHLISLLYGVYLYIVLRRSWNKWPEKERKEKKNRFEKSGGPTFLFRGLIMSACLAGGGGMGLFLVVIRTNQLSLISRKFERKEKKKVQK